MKNIIKSLCLILITSLLFSLLMSCDSFGTDIYIFSDISECANIEKNKHDDGEITFYENPTSDINLKNLEFLEFYAAEYKSSKLEFCIFAYNFKDKDTAKKYFENATGRYDKRDVNFSSHLNPYEYSILVINEQLAYSIVSPPSQFDELNEYLSTIFSIKL